MFYPFIHFLFKDLNDISHPTLHSKCIIYREDSSLPWGINLTYLILNLSPYIYIQPVHLGFLRLVLVSASSDIPIPDISLIYLI